MRLFFFAFNKEIFFNKEKKIINFISWFIFNNFCHLYAYIFFGSCKSQIHIHIEAIFWEKKPESENSVVFERQTW